MKRLLLTLLCVLFAYPCFAAEPIQLARMNPWVAGSVASSAGPCDNLGSNQAYYDSDHTTNNTTYCKQSGTGTITLTNATVSSDYNHTTGGGASVKHEAGTPERYTIPVASSLPMTSSEYYISMWLWIGDTTGTNNEIFKIVGGATDLIYAEINTNNTIHFVHKGNNVLTSIVSTATINMSEWNKLEFRGSVSNNKISININSGGWADDADADAVTAFVIEPSTIVIGSNSLNISDTYYTDDVTIDDASGI